MQANLSILIVGIFPFKMNLVIFELNYNMFLLNASGYCHIGILSISRVFFYSFIWQAVKRESS
ncbi:hypothetical protein NEQG_01015 [Nematocida parisii ERTm3]|uniref:Uncharacterized protein n=1 Tax=Nematocida parisii (strain ERTm3) TaxID=935791 RepID=I3EIZ9_NEMP3|nr:hypothetical protein NEQG_01015 [Nematocida parisii ERTm3]